MNASIALTRAEDGTLTGSITIGGEVWTITNWRQGGDKLHILFDATPAEPLISNAEMARMFPGAEWGE